MTTSSMSPPAPREPRRWTPPLWSRATGPPRSPGASSQRWWNWASWTSSPLRSGKGRRPCSRSSRRSSPTSTA
uniref:Alternative protein ARHGEF16 n=1 Tax=Homo sapiens TaxID=9606 RepID=L8EAP0_HUMAN|nr:alternative protein ARHGEF16 [Homo sapiens]